MHYLLSFIKLQIPVIGICVHKIKRGSCLNGSLPGYTFGGVEFFINDKLRYKVRNDWKMLLNGCLESIFIEISFDKKEKDCCWSYLSASPYAD